MDSKTLSFILFGSLAANFFLGGIVTAKMFGEDAHQAAPETATAGVDQRAKEKEDKKAKKKLKDARKKAKHLGKHGGKRRGGPGGHSSDLMLLRHMVKVMGGPRDPRISELQEKKKEDIKTMRSEMKAAHDRVYRALTAEEPDKAELEESLKALGKKTFEAQARAQEGIITLHSLMTPEERKQLRDFKPRGPEPGGPGRRGSWGRRSGAHERA